MTQLDNDQLARIAGGANRCGKNSWEVRSLMRDLDMTLKQAIKYCRGK